MISLWSQFSASVDSLKIILLESSIDSVYLILLITLLLLHFPPKSFSQRTSQHLSLTRNVFVTLTYGNSKCWNFLHFKIESRLKLEDIELLKHAAEQYIFYVFNLKAKIAWWTICCIWFRESQGWVPVVHKIVI